VPMHGPLPKAQHARTGLGRGSARMIARSGLVGWIGPQPMVDLDPSVGVFFFLKACWRRAVLRRASVVPALQCFACGRGGHSTLLKAWVNVQYVCMFCRSNNVARVSCLVMVLGIRG
jgi:hypothetical protein